MNTDAEDIDEEDIADLIEDEEPQYDEFGDLIPRKKDVDDFGEEETDF